MYLIYFDESGDPGLGNSPSPYFALTGVAVHELRWHEYREQLLYFRRRINYRYHLPVSAELHAAPLLKDQNSPIKENDRLAILRQFADELATMDDLRLINIVVNKRRKPIGYDVFNSAWTRLIREFDKALEKRELPGPNNYAETGMLFPDQTAQGKLTSLLRSMRRANPSASVVPVKTRRGLLITNIVENPLFYNSAESLYIQAADLAAYFLYQHIAPNKYMRQKKGYADFLRLEPILYKGASGSDKLGIITL